MNKADQLSNETKRQINSSRVPMEVSPYEASLIKEIRKINFGRVTVVLFDGVVDRIEVGQSFKIFPDGFEDGLEKLTKGGELH